MKLFILLFWMIVSNISGYASEPMSKSLPINRIIIMENLAKAAQQRIDTYGQEHSDEEIQLLKRYLEQESRQLTNTLIDDITNPQYLYTMAIILHEGFPESWSETVYDKILSTALEQIVMRLAQLGTEKAYDYFILLKNSYGRDGGESLIYRSLEFKYLKNYSKDPKVLEAKSAKDFV